jgi:hypothetical protein
MIKDWNADVISQALGLEYIHIDLNNLEQELSTVVQE